MGLSKGPTGERALHGGEEKEGGEERNTSNDQARKIAHPGHKILGLGDRDPMGVENGKS